VACRPSLHLLIPLWFDHLIHEITSRCNDMGGISISIYRCHSRECFVGLAGSTYHSTCHTWNPNTPHTAKLLSSFRADILLYAGVPPRLDMYMANKQIHGQRTGTLDLVSPRQNISLGAPPIIELALAEPQQSPFVEPRVNQARDLFLACKAVDPLP
jgi:hypothetical protein